MKFVMECGPCDGDKAYALDLVDLFAEQFSGVAMKVQFYTADTLASRGAPRYDHTDDRPLSQNELFKTQLSYDDWAEVAAYAQKKVVEFFPSVFSVEAVKKAREMGINTFKIASGDITHLSLIRQAAEWNDFGKSSHVIISTGAANEYEIQAAVTAASSAKVTLLACHLAYPTDFRQAELGRVETLRDLFPRHDIGYSDHTPGVSTIGPLAALKARMWEKHFSARDDSVKDGDHAFAIRPIDLDFARRLVRNFTEAMGSGTLFPTPAELAAREGARRSLAAATDIKRGEVLTWSNVTFLRPATGIDFETANRIVGLARARQDISRGVIINGSMVQ